MDVSGLNIGISFVAGALSFLSPCILPLIPAYLSLMGGTTLDNLKEDENLRRIAFFNTVFFVIGFSIVFVALGVLFSSTFALFSGVSRIINIVAGAVIVALGFNFIFDFWKVLNFEKRFHMQKRPTSKPASLLFGMAFGAGWSPCIGPILSSILLLAGSSGSVIRGISLLLIYSLGLGLPFLLTGLFLPSALRQLDRIKRHMRVIKIGSGIFLVLIGLLILAGRLQRFNNALFSFAYQLESWEQSYPTAARLVFGAIFLTFAAITLTFYLRKRSRDRPIEDLDPSMETSVTNKDGVGEQVKEAGSKVLLRHIRPVRITVLLVFTAASLLSFIGIINFSRLFAIWFNFQGI